MSIRRIVVWMSVLALVFALGMTGCGPAEDDIVDDDDEPVDDPTDTPEQILRVALRADIQDFDPVYLEDAPTSGVAFQIYEHLVARDFDGTLMEGLAQDWEASEDAMVWTFHLREGVKFHDGSDFTAEVVKFHYERIMDPDTGSHAMESFRRNIKRIDAIDDLTLEIELHEPNAAFIDQVIITNAGYIPSMEAVKELGDDLAHNPVGTGPFKFNEWVPDTRVVLDRYEDYWKGPAKLEQVIFRPIPETGTQMAELRTGGIHIMTTVPPEHLETLQADDEIVVLTEPDFNIRYLVYNMNNPLFQDVQVRQALNHAVDVENLVGEFLRGVADKAVGPFAIQSWAHDPNVPQFEYDPDRAEELLEEAGWTRGDDGMFQKDGQTLNFTLSTPVGRYTKDQEVCEAVHYQLRQFGIDVELEPLEFATLIDKLSEREYDLGYIGFMTRSGEPAAMPDHLYMSGGWANWGDYSNEEVDALMDAGRATADFDERREIYSQAQELIALDAPIIPIMNEYYMLAHRAELQGYEFSAARTMDYTNIEIVD